MYLCFRGFAPGLLVLLGVWACTEDPSAPAGPAAVPVSEDARKPAADVSRPQVHTVYLVPADRDPISAYRSATRFAIRHLQLWFRDALGIGESFRTASPPVTVHRLPHDAEWYRTTPNGPDPALWFWFNVLQDAFALTGGSFFDPDLWIYYIDADPGCGQVTGGAAGVALLPANDLRGLTGEGTRDVCSGEPEPDQGVCRWIGGLGHELGHALGLPHPPGCETGDPACAAGSLMWLGYISYPAAFLTSEEQTALGVSPFFLRFSSNRPLPSCGILPRTPALARQIGPVAAAPSCSYQQLGPLLSTPRGAEGET